MFLAHQDQNIIGGKKRKPKYDNYSMKTYIFRDLESNSTHDKPPAPTGVAGDFWNILILLLLYTIQGETISYSHIACSISILIYPSTPHRHSDWSQWQCTGPNEGARGQLLEPVPVLHGINTLLD